MSNSRSPWQTTAAASKNKLNDKVKSFLAPKMQGTAEFCSTDKREFGGVILGSKDYILNEEEREEMDDDRMF